MTRSELKAKSHMHLGAAQARGNRCGACKLGGGREGDWVYAPAQSVRDFMNLTTLKMQRASLEARPLS